MLITGHTGFKGSWLSLWLSLLDARVFGYALAPEQSPAFFDQLGLAEDVDHHVADIRDAAALRRRISQVRPDVVFHLAAQPLVRRSYAEPVDTWHTNVMGTVHLLDSLRDVGGPCAAVMVTTDKVYENMEWPHPYRESDRLGGHDPYSSSKAACELAIDSWRRSFLEAGSPVRVASARAGNVIGGGDWSVDRIVPDLARSLASGTPVVVRNPSSVRPWQHVLDPLSGYMLLAERLAGDAAGALRSSFNFGPEPSGCCTVQELLDRSFRHWPGTAQAPAAASAHHEATLLSLDISKVRATLGWKPRWDLDMAVERTISWYRDVAGGAEVRRATVADIKRFQGFSGGRPTP